MSELRYPLGEAARTLRLLTTLWTSRLKYASSVSSASYASYVHDAGSHQDHLFPKVDLQEVPLKHPARVDKRTGDESAVVFSNALWLGRDRSFVTGEILYKHSTVVRQPYQGRTAGTWITAPTSSCCISHSPKQGTT